MKNSVPSPAFGTPQGQAQSQPVAQATRGKRARSELARLRELALLPALALLLVIGAFVSPSFLTKANLISVLGASAALALVVLAGCVRGLRDAMAGGSGFAGYPRGRRGDRFH